MQQPLTRYVGKGSSKPRVKGDNPGSLCACVLCTSVHKSRSHTTCPLRGPDSITIRVWVLWSDSSRYREFQILGVLWGVKGQYVIIFNSFPTVYLPNEREPIQRIMQRNNILVP